MRTLHVGLRVSDLERSLAFYTGLGYEVLGKVPETEFGSLTMLKLRGDEFVTIELVHDPRRGVVDPGGLNHLVVQVESMPATVAELTARGVQVEAPASPPRRARSSGMQPRRAGCAAGNADEHWVNREPPRRRSLPPSCPRGGPPATAPIRSGSHRGR